MPLDILDFKMRPPANAASCGLLRQRESERVKVIRELSHLTRRVNSIEGDEVSESSYRYWLSKLFMPTEDWSETRTEVVVTIRQPHSLRLQAQNEGLGSVMLMTRGPGFVWQSYADQLPPEMTMTFASDVITIRYFTFLNAVCDPDFQPVSVEWIQE